MVLVHFLVYDAWADFLSWIDSVDWGNVVFYIAFVLLAVTIVTLSIWLVVAHTKDKEFQSEMTYESSTVRVFRVDATHDNVRYFNLSNIGVVKSQTLNQFYASFPLSEQGKVREWITSILNGEPHSTYLATDVIFHKERHMAPSFLKLVSAKPEVGMIHLESYLLRYTKPSRSLSRSFATEADFAQAMKANGTRSGMTFCFALLPNESDGPLDENEKTPLTPDIQGRFRDAIGPFAAGNQKIIQAAENELIIANFDMIESAQAITFSLRVIDAVDRALSGYKRKGMPAFVVRAGIVANKDLLGDSDAILTEARRSAESAFETDSAISFYKKGSQDFSSSDELHYRTEVERLIYERKISYTYRPVYDCNALAVNGYIARALPVNTSFASIDELKNYAARAKDEKNLFAAIAKNLVPRFVNERPDPDSKLYYPVRMAERGQLLPFFTHFPDVQKANLVFIFREEDITASLDKAGITQFLYDVGVLKRNGFGFGIIISGKSLSLDAGIYSACDVFFVDFSSGGDESNMDTKVRSALHALVERLLKYKKPIVAANLMSWNAIELVVGSGIDYISSDLFAPYDTMFRPVISRSVDRIKTMKQRR
jgi:hypothetical protein